MNNLITLSVGDDFHLKLGKDHIIYAGMPSENVYSIVQKKTSGYQGFTWNLFFPRRQLDITVDKVKIFVESVVPEEIRFRVG